MRAFAAGMLALTLAGCGDSQRPRRLDQEGDPCRASLPNCVDEQTARVCIDGLWEDRSCDDVCAERGPALISEGCATITDNLLEDCVCVPEPGACAPGATACESDTELGYCDAEQVWGVHDCGDVCAASLATSVSLGCEVDEDGGAACWCVAEDPG